MPIYGPDLHNPVAIADLLKFGLENKPDEDAIILLRAISHGVSWTKLQPGLLKTT